MNVWLSECGGAEARRKATLTSLCGGGKAAEKLRVTLGDGERVDRPSLSY
jgi:hypothetical protein